MITKYDLIVIGSGMGSGLVHEYKMAFPDKRVAIIDRRPFGGTCPQRGCNPKKVMFQRFRTLYLARRLEGSGLEGDVVLDWPSLVEEVKRFTAPVGDSMRKGFGDAGIDCYEGHAAFISSDQVRVDDTVLQGDRIVIATGSRPRELGIPGSEHAIVSDDFFELKMLPDEMLFIGGGYISLEFAHMVALAGTKVTILQRGNAVLPMFDAEVTEKLCDTAKEHGIDIRFNQVVTEIVREHDGYTVRTKDDEVRTGLVFNGTGRVPDIDGLEIDSAGVQVQYDKRGEPIGIPVDSKLRTNVGHIYAIGDVLTQSPKLTPVGTIESSVVSHNLIHGDVKDIDYGVIPSIAFTEPEIASVGMKEQELDDPSAYTIIPKEGRSQPSFADKSRNLDHAYKKFIVDKEGYLVGAHLVGYGIEDLINMYAVIIQNRIPVSTLWLAYAYPTESYDHLRILSGGVR